MARVLKNSKLNAQKLTAESGKERAAVRKAALVKALEATQGQHGLDTKSQKRRQLLGDPARDL